LARQLRHAVANRVTLRGRLGRAPKPTGPPAPSTAANRATLCWRLRRAHVGMFLPTCFGRHFWPAVFGQHVCEGRPSGGQGPRGAHGKIGERFALQEIRNVENILTNVQKHRPNQQNYKTYGKRMAGTDAPCRSDGWRGLTPPAVASHVPRTRGEGGCWGTGAMQVNITNAYDAPRTTTRLELRRTYSPY
jgi:hypothetical protein